MDEINTQGSRSEVVFMATLISVILSFTLIVLRLISRIVILKRTSWDDYFIVLAWLLSFGLSFSICFATRYGLGKPDHDIIDEWRNTLSKSQYAFTVLYNPTLMATKTSILIFYLKLSENTQRVFRWVTIVTLVAVNLAGVAFTILNLTQCRPLHLAFQYPLPAAKCNDILKISLSSAPMNIITDCVILFLPMPLLTGLRLPRRQKIILIGVFGLGIFVAIVDVLRVVYLEEALQGTLDWIQSHENKESSRFTKYNDLAWYASLSFMWSVIEVNVGIICVCIPTLKPLVSRVWPRLLSDGGLIDKPPSPTQLRREIEELEPRGTCVNTLDFVTMPGDSKSLVNSLAGDIEASQTAIFGFVDLNVPKSMVKLSNRESLRPLISTALLSLVLGLAYGFLNTLNCQYQQSAKMPVQKMVVLHSSYFWGYFASPLTFGLQILKRGGFKPTFITGLCIYSCGILAFWPSAILPSYPAFVISNFIVGAGLSTIEVALNPFVSLCGPARYAEIRFNLTMAIQAIGTTLSPILARKLLFRSISDTSLINAQWAYLAIALMCILAALAFYYIPLPEVNDDELAELAAGSSEANSAKIGPIKVIYLTLGLGVFALFFFVGGRESAAVMTFRGPLTPNFTSPMIRNIGHGCFSIGCFLSAALLLILKPRHLLPLYQTGLITTAALAMSLPPKSTPVNIDIIMEFFFQSAIRPTIFAISLRGLGSYTKTGAALLTAASSGGAIFPAVMDPVMWARDQYAWCFMVACFSCTLVFSVYLNLVPKAQRQVDPVVEKREVSPRSEGEATESDRLEGLV